MWQISIVKKINGKTHVLTKSLYPTQKAADAAATALRLISRGWSYCIRSIECDRPNAPTLRWKFHDYSVIPPKEIQS